MGFCLLESQEAQGNYLCSSHELIDYDFDGIKEVVKDLVNVKTEEERNKLDQTKLNF